MCVHVEVRSWCPMSSSGSLNQLAPSHDLDSKLGVLLLYASSLLSSQACALSFYVCTGDLNSRPYDCTASTWPTELPPQYWHLYFFNISRRNGAMLSHSLLNNNHIEDCSGVRWSNCFTERIYSTHETICVRGYFFAEWGWIFFSKIDSTQPSYSQGLNFLRIISLLPERIS